MHKLICVIIGVWVIFSADIAASAFAQDSELKAQEHLLDPNDPLSGLVAEVDVFLEHLKHDRYEEATAKFESLVAAHWNHCFKILVKIRAKDTTDLADRQQALKCAIFANPDDPVLHRLLGYVCLMKGAYVDSKDQLAQASELDPSNPVPFFLRGDSYLDRHNLRYTLTPKFKKLHRLSEFTTKNAIEDISMAIQLEPENARYFMSRARMRGCLLGEKEAIEDVQQAINLGHDPCECFVLQGQIHTYLNDDKAAVDDYTSAIAELENRVLEGTSSDFTDYTSVLPIDSLLVQCYIARGHAKGHLKDYCGAIEDLSVAAKTGKHLDADFFVARANMYIAIKDYRAALANLDTKDACTYSFEYFDRRAWVKLHLNDFSGA